MHYATHRWLFAATIIASVTSPAWSQTGTQRGATLGGIAGAVAGGLIGDNNGEAGTGAVIGGALGAVAGGVLGNAKDQDAAAARARQQYQQQQYTYQQSLQTAAAITPSDVVSMSRSGLGDSVIINQIRTRGVAQTLNVHDLITLHQQGVSEPVLTAMQQTPPATVQNAPVVEVPSPVVIREREYVPMYGRPAYYGRPGHYHYGPPRYHHRPQSQFWIGF